MVKYFIFSLLLFFASFLEGQNTIQNIPDSLLTNADGVMLKNDHILEFLAKDDLIYTVDQSILILSNSADDLNNVILSYDKFKKIEEIKITILDEKRNVIKTVKRKDMQDIAVNDGITLASDHRYLYYKVSHPKTPIFLDIQYKISAKQSFYIIPYSINKKNTSIWSGNYTLKNHDVKNKVRFSGNYHKNLKIDTLPELHSYHFEFLPQHFNSINNEDKNNDKGIIYTVMEDFVMDGVSGNFSSWKNFGMWLTKLNEGQQTLDLKVQQDVKDIIKGETNKVEIVKKLYTYLQANTRYVSIQLGIGGWKPMSAQEVHETKFGDCKALSNYMHSLLKVVDINSFYVIISAGKDHKEPNEEFPQNVFNHAILGVPLESDTIYLECTSSSNDFGYLGTFTSDRTALCVDGSNSKLIKTTSYDENQNIMVSKYKISLKPDHISTITAIKQFEGIMKEYLSYENTKNMDENAFNAFFLEQSKNGLSNLVIKQRRYNPYHLSFEYTSDYGVSRSNNRFQIPMEQDNMPILKNISFNKNILEIEIGETRIDTISLEIPLGCIVEKGVQNFEFDTPMIKLQTHFYHDRQSVSVIRKSVLKKGKFIVDDSNQLEKIKKSVTKFCTEKMVILCKS